MKSNIPINLVVEDSLSEAVLRAILEQSSNHYSIGNCYGQTGYGYLKKKIHGFNHAAKGTPFLVLTDLDKGECPLLLLREWLSEPKHPNLLFRVAVREVESWVLGHREGFSKFFGIHKEEIPQNLDTIDDPKQLLINLTKMSKNRRLRDAIVPMAGSTAKVGPDYNGTLISFIRSHWKVEIAMQHSISLQRAVIALNSFRPTWKR